MEVRISASRSQGVSTHKRQKPRSTGEGLSCSSYKDFKNTFKARSNAESTFFFMYKTIIGESIYYPGMQHHRFSIQLFEPHREKTGFLHMQKQRSRSASR